MAGPRSRLPTLLLLLLLLLLLTGRRCTAAAADDEALLKAAVADVDSALKRPAGEDDLVLWAAVDRQPTVLAKYAALEAVQVADPARFFALLRAHALELAGVVYTPGVGEACVHYGDLPRTVPVLSIPLGVDAETLRADLAAWADLRLVVVTDGERVLGLGDLGVWGAPIVVGKLRMHVLGSGLDPALAVPAVLDAGTNNAELRASPRYHGRRDTARVGITNTTYIATVRALATVLGARTPPPLLHFEDFGRASAFALLELAAAEQWPLPVFNDDIQGTGAVVLAALWAALPLTPQTALHEHTYLIVGAGQAGVGIAQAVERAMTATEGRTPDDARRTLWLVDASGLVTTARSSKLPNELQPYAQSVGSTMPTSLLDIVRLVRPTVLIGVSGQGQLFTPAILAAMADSAPRPVVFALSNPSDHAECDAATAYAATSGRAIFASGGASAALAIASPAPAGDWGGVYADMAGTVRSPAQVNNAFIFPGVVQGTLAAGARRVTDATLLAAARALAGLVTDADRALGRVLPALDRLSDATRAVASAVAAAGDTLQNAKQDL